MNDTRTSWQIPTRIAFRFLASYLILHGHMFPLGYLPFAWARAVSEWHLEARIAAANWTQVHVFGLPTPLPFAFTGSGDSMARFAMHSKIDGPAHSVALTARGSAPSSTIALTYEAPDADYLMLRGQMGEDAIVVHLKRLDETTFLLLNRPFTWIQERPFNR